MPPEYYTLDHDVPFWSLTWTFSHWYLFLPQCFLPVLRTIPRYPKFTVIGSFGNALLLISGSLPSLQTACSRWMPLFKPFSSGGFFLLKGSFSFLLSPSALWVLCIIVLSLPHNIKPFEATAVVLYKQNWNGKKCFCDRLLVKSLKDTIYIIKFLNVYFLLHVDTKVVNFLS